MGNCGTCKHWSSHAWDEGELISVVNRAGRAWCLRITNETDEEASPEERAIVRVDDHQLGESKLATRGDFGCTEWEAKERPVVLGAKEANPSG